MKIRNLWFAFDAWQDGFNPENCNADVHFDLPDGSRWCASFYTYQNLLHLAQKNRETGECLSGQYFYADKPVFIDRMTKERIIAVICDILAEVRNPETVFTKVSD